MPAPGVMIRILALCLWVTSIHAQRSAWVTPAGTRPDNTDAYSNADLVTIAWEAMAGGLSDLWLNAVESNYAVRLGSNINISVPGTYPWTITVGDEEIDIDSHFELTFIPTGTTYNKENLDQYEQSPAFILVKRGEPLPTAASSGAPTNSLEAPSSVAPTATSSPATGMPTSTAGAGADDQSGPSIGMKVGIAIGVVAAVVVILGLLFWALRLRRKVKAVNNHRSSGIVPASGVMPGRSSPPTEKRISGLHEVNGDHVQPVEMTVRPKTVYHELSG